jgi:HAD superfamily hydrolase (TIGR01509 family)
VFEAIFWDNDGVLVDTEGLYYRANREVLATVGVPLPEADYVELFLRQGRGAWHLARELGLDGERVAALRAERDARYARLLEAEATFIPGVEEALRTLAGRYRMAVVTSSLPGHFDLIHRHGPLLHFFEFVLTGADYQHTKPHPEPYLRALERVRLGPRQCLVIEDSERGLRAAKAAGLTCWIVPSGLTAGCRFEAADRVLGSVSEVAGLLSS